MIRQCMIMYGKYYWLVTWSIIWCRLLRAAPLLGWLVFSGRRLRFPVYSLDDYHMIFKFNPVTMESSHQLR